MTSREDTFLSDELLRQLMGVGEIDLLVGINAHEANGAADGLADQVEEVCLRNFVRDRIALVSANGHRPAPESEFDREPRREPEEQPVVRAGELRRGVTALRTIHKLSPEFDSEPDNGLKTRTLLAIADLLRAKAVAVVTPPAAAISPEWLVNLVKPIRRDNFDFVAPLYRRSWNQGLLMRNLLYPMLRAVFGYRIREPFAEDFAISGRLAGQCLDRDEWQQPEVRARPESWLAVEAISAASPICQSFLGPKDYPTSASGAAIVQAIRHTVGGLFWLMETHSSLWLETKDSKPVHTVGPEHEVICDPTRVNRERTQDLFRTGVSDLEPVLRTILTEDTLQRIQAIANNSNELCFPTELWVRALYEFALGYHHQVIDRDHLVQALVPLYRGKAGAYLEHNCDSDSEGIESECEALCLEFERQKPFLTEKWNEKAR